MFHFRMVLKSLFFLFLITSSSCSYLPEPLAETPGLIVEETAEYISLSTSSIDDSKAGIVFNPGGLVDPHTYIEALQD